LILFTNQSASVFDTNARRSRCKIKDIGNNAYKLLPSDSRRRGLAAIGLELENPAAIDLEPVATGTTVVRARELRDGKKLGEIEVEVFKAALVIDRDGILEEKAHLAVDAERGRVTPPVPVSLAGASGYRAEVVRVPSTGAPRPELPYTYVFAVAPDDLGAEGGVLITVRCATPEWPAADSILRSLKVLGRRNATANDGEGLALPMLGARKDE
jgi:hypothetical protein